MTIALDKITFSLVCPVAPHRRADGQIAEFVLASSEEG